MVKERGILMGTPMVKAILNGSKTQTRRVISPRPIVGINGYLDWKDASMDPLMLASYCPYGKVGDRLWVREKYLIETSGSCRYDADGLRPGEFPGWLQRASQVHYAATTPLKSLGKWRPGIHMPRWASRIVLEITEVRAQPLQDIDHDDAMAEGCFNTGAGFSFDMEKFGESSHAETAFECLWDSINAGRGYPWASNPFVWPITFKVVS